MDFILYKLYYNRYLENVKQKSGEMQKAFLRFLYRFKEGIGMGGVERFVRPHNGN